MTVYHCTDNFETSSKTYYTTVYDLLRLDARRRNAKYLLYRTTNVKDSDSLDLVGYNFKSHSVANFENKCMLTFSLGTFKVIQPSTTQYVRALHPIVTLAKITSMLREFIEQVDLDLITKDLLIGAFRCDEYVEIGLLHTLHCSGNDGLSLSPFVLHADNYFVSDTNRRHSSSARLPSYQNFSFCAIQYADNEVVVSRIMAIISLVRESPMVMKEERFLLLVMRLQPFKATNTAQVFPFTSLKYKFSRDYGYELDLVELSSFHTPVCVFESPTHDFETMTNISTDTTFYQIPTTRLLNTEPVVSYAQLQAMREECDITPNNTRNVYLTDEELKDILECYQSNTILAKDYVVDYCEGSDSDYSESF